MPMHKGGDQALALDLADKVQFADGGIVSKTILSNPHCRVVLFCFDSGQLLSEHTAAFPASMHVLSGRCRVVMGDEEHEAKQGFWAHMPAHLPHSITAAEQTVLLLTIYRASSKPE